MTENKEITVYDKLVALYKLQVLDSKIDEIRQMRGDSPLKVKDLEDELVGLQTRKEKIDAEINTFNEQISEKKNIIAEAKEKLKKYNDQQNKVRNNREFEALSKQIEYEELETQLSDKRIKEYSIEIKKRQDQIAELDEEIKEKKQDFESSKNELDSIISDTERDEQTLKDIRTTIEEKIEKRLLKAYLRIRKGLRNGLAVVPVIREACDGCHNRIPPQRQIDIESKKKIIVCEFCGRILVDDEIVNVVDQEIKDLNIHFFDEEE